MPMKISILLLLITLAPASQASGNGSVIPTADVSLDEKLNGYVAPDAVLTDDAGRKMRLKDMIDKPTIIAPVYFGCLHECPMLLNSLAQVLGRMQLVKPGIDYSVIALSFDERDTPEIARDKKRNYLKAIGKPFPEESWKFVTGDASNIKAVTDSIGFRFQRDGEHDFSHPLTLVVATRDGRSSATSRAWVFCRSR